MEAAVCHRLVRDRPRAWWSWQKLRFLQHWHFNLRTEQKARLAVDAWTSRGWFSFWSQSQPLVCGFEQFRVPAGCNLGATWPWGATEQLWLILTWGYGWMLEMI